MDSFHAFLNSLNQKKKLTTLMTTSTASPISKLTTTTPIRNLAIHNAIRHWAFYQVFRHLDKKKEKVTPATPSTTKMTTATTIGSAMTITNSESSTKGKNLAYHHALRPLHETL